MMEKVVSKELLLKMVQRIADTIEEHKDHLTELDSAVGDGDHGVSMARGFAAVMSKMDEMKDKDISGILNLLGITLVSVIGGATGPIFGTLFIKAGAVARGKDVLTVEDLAGMFEAGLNGVKTLGQAKVGDKTMVDALEPAVKALRSAANDGIELKAALNKAVEAARVGADSTANLVGKKGRSRFLGESGVGFQDAGANSTYYLFKAMAEAVR